jgi:hypothetical protein
MRGVRKPFPSESDPGTAARDGNWAGAVARIIKAVMMVRKRDEMERGRRRVPVV